MTGLSSDARSLLQRVRQTHEPSRAEQERVRAALAIRLATGAALATSAAAAGQSSASAASLKALSLSKALLSGLVLGSLGMGAFTFANQGAEEKSSAPAAASSPRPRATSSHARTSAAPAPSAAAAPQRIADDGERSAPTPSADVRAASNLQQALRNEAVPMPAATAAAEPEVPVLEASSNGSFAAPPVAVSASPQVTSPPQRDGQTLAEEARALAEAQRALDQGAPAIALELLSRHERRFGAGMLGQERAAARIFALCALGRRADAQREGARFLALAPQSPLASRVKLACASSK